ILTQCFDSSQPSQQEKPGLILSLILTSILLPWPHHHHQEGLQDNEPPFKMFCRKQLLAGRFLPVAIAFILGFSLASILLQEPHQNDQIITKLATKANDTATFLTIL